MTPVATVEGRAYPLRLKNVDTDVIIPARYLTTIDPAELAQHCMEDLDPTFCSTCKLGDLMVGGKNFGSGSSREHAPISISASGIACIVAESFARIFFRNCVNMGLLLPIQCDHPFDLSVLGKRVTVDTSQRMFTALGRSFGFADFGPLEDIIAAGGLTAYNKARIQAGLL